MGRCCGSDGRENDREGKKSFFVAAEKLNVALIADALKAWEKSNKLPFEPIEFKSEKETCWGCFQPLNTNDWTVLIGVAVPESDLLGKINNKRMWILLPALGILATGILLIVLLLRKYSYQIKDLPKQIIKRDVIENEVISLIKAGESSALEFKSTMRMNLKTGKPSPKKGFGVSGLAFGAVGIAVVLADVSVGDENPCLAAIEAAEKGVKVSPKKGSWSLQK